ncbi:hypothetical protein FPOA_17809 [Fusarium poae]|uniref:HTH CENPB-type domain-containing protein n=1 Tax=Fusarium poae TaxID=36050 RepID=A0A1B8AK06_FUSPO|nr:hypothetical protein FPOA_21116 [Fusarium poae]OBS20569.1 hypothetical protein FPOA_21161 [Fusarium poae]OBS20614.1 hypothetical protein FPOA_21206 [Fusarium poae]OBS20677.1 hypothetical protein FPOA_21269 [Fusarium poae]OBS23087.1 hypothetical protein FPOA_17809 [Fusarium poae]
MSLPVQLRTDRAIDDVLRGTSIREASKRHLVDRTYLTRRINGIPTKEEVDEKKQVLSRHQETHLANWAIAQGRLGYAPPMIRFRFYAQHILKHNGSTHTLGKNWHSSFFKRHPALKCLKSKLIDYKRVDGANTANINLFFDRFDTPEVQHIPLRHTYNADEFGLMEGVGDNGMVVGESYRKFVLVKDHQKRTWTSILECVSGDGRVLDPLIIFAGKYVQQQWFPDKDNEVYATWKFETSPNGWTNNDIALKWLRSVFIPQTKPQDSDQWRLLILDGHGSHTTEEFMLECYIHKIWLLFLPAHSSHVLQPLDLGVFSALKRAYRRAFTISALLHCNPNPGKQEFLHAYQLARKERLISVNILAGWQASGIFPRNRSKPLNSRFVRRGDPDATSAPISAFPTPPAPDFAQKMSAVDVQTPKSSRDLVKLQRSLMAVDPAFGQSAARLLFRKVGKALDDNIVKLTAAEVQTDHLTNALEKARPQKRRRVIPDPNKDFVELHEVQTEKARLAAEGGGESDIHSDLEGSTLSDSGSEKSSEAEDCIEVRNPDFEST